VPVRLAANCRGCRARRAAILTDQPRACFLALRGLTLAAFEFLNRLSFLGLTVFALYGFAL